MRITHIRLRKLESRPHSYGHVAVEMEAEVGEDDDLDQAIHDLRDHVDGELHRQLDQSGDQARSLTLSSQILQLERDHDRLTKEIADNRTVIAEYNLLAEEAKRRGIPGHEEMPGNELPF